MSDTDESKEELEMDVADLLGAHQGVSHQVLTMGRETNQGEIAVEFDGQFYRMTQYDAPQEDENDSSNQNQ